MKKILPFIIPLFRPLLFILTSILFSYLVNTTLDEVSRWWPIICIFCNILTIMFLLYLCKIENIKYFDLINYRKIKSNFKNTVKIILAMFITGLGGMILSSLLIYNNIQTDLIQPLPLWISSIILFLLPITIIFSELPLYFGYSLNRIYKITNKKYLAIIYTMFFYSLQHSFIPLLFNWNHIIFRFISFSPLILILSFIYFKTKNLKPLMFGHFLLDFATGIQILVISIL